MIKDLLINFYLNIVCSSDSDNNSEIYKMYEFQS